MKKKIKMIFIHGWGFDHFFWEPLVKELLKNSLKLEINFLNLGFFGSRDLRALKVNSKDSYLIYVVHSYGYNWFIKNKIKCDLMINFCGSHNLIENSKFLNLEIIEKMVKKIKTKPELVLSKFYTNCGLKNYNIEAKLDKDILIEALNGYLVEPSQNKNLPGDSAKMIFSIFSKKDRILNIKNFQLLENHLKYNIKLLDNENHAFPYSNPSLAASIIEICIKKKVYENKRAN